MRSDCVEFALAISRFWRINLRFTIHVMSKVGDWRKTIRLTRLYTLSLRWNLVQAGHLYIACGDVTSSIVFERRFGWRYNLRLRPKAVGKAKQIVRYGVEAFTEALGGKEIGGNCCLLCDGRS